MAAANTPVPSSMLPFAKGVNINSFAADLVLFGSEDFGGVAEAHGLNQEQAVQLLESHTALRAQVSRLKKQIESDPKAVIRLKAASALEGNISVLNLMVKDKEAEVKERTAAMRLLAELADALPKQDKAATNAGVILQLNLGTPSTVDTAQLPRPVNVVAHAT